MLPFKVKKSKRFSGVGRSFRIKKSGKKKSCNSKKAVKSNPQLWERIKKSVMKGSKGGPAGKWSARKAQLLVAKYKKSGGKFKGKKSKCNSLSKWSREEWGYVGKPKKSRYLPKKVRKMLTKREKSIENKRKGSKRGKWIPYSRSVSKKMRKAGIY